MLSHKRKSTDNIVNCIVIHKQEVLVIITIDSGIEVLYYCVIDKQRGSAMYYEVGAPHCAVDSSKQVSPQRCEVCVVTLQT